METDNKKRIDTATKKLLRTLMSLGAEVEPLVSGFWYSPKTNMYSIDDVPTYIRFDTAGRYAAPSALLKIAFGTHPRDGGGNRLTLREPKAGFDFKTIAHRVLAWTVEEQARLDERARHDKIRAINQSLANKLRRVYQEKKKLPVRFSSYERDKSPVVDVDIHLDNVTEAVAVRVTKAVEKALRTKALQRKQ